MQMDVRLASTGKSLLPIYNTVAECPKFLDYTAMNDCQGIKCQYCCICHTR